MVKFKAWLKTYLLTGLIVVVPITITIYIIQSLMRAMDAFLSFLPNAYHPDILLGRHIPGLGLVLVTIMVFLIGLLTHNYVGKKVIKLWDLMVGRIPVVRNIYQAIKQLTEAIFSNTGSHFKQVVLLEFPRPGLYSLGFVSGPARGELEAKAGHHMVNIFIPCTPNPTTGYYVLVPEKDLILLEMTVEDGFKMVISSGLVSPNNSLPNPR
ncbi:MAG: hypothetical protein C0407_02400 [Desulfobacca sp.]|nr:hypothetical protein [Desulfobacca sp.]